MLVVDGNLKAQRKICGAAKSGVKVFEDSNTTLVTGSALVQLCIFILQVIIGCTKHPGDNKYCSSHQNEDTPAVSSSKLQVDIRSKLRSSKEKSKQYQEQDFTDSVYIIEGATPYQTLRAPRAAPQVLLLLYLACME